MTILYQQLSPDERHRVDQARIQADRALIAQVVKEEMKTYKPAPDKSTPESRAYFEKFIKEMKDRALPHLTHYSQRRHDNDTERITRRMAAQTTGSQAGAE